MTDGPSRRPAEPESLREVLTNDELRELLSPLPVDPDTGGPRPSILVISNDPSDVSLLSEYLMPRGISVVPARDRFAALDVFRERPFLGVIADIDAVGQDAPGYVQRLEQVRPSVVVRFLCAPGESATPGAQRLESHGKIVERPLDAAKLALLCSFLPDELPATAGNGAVVGPTPDPLVAVRALLEAKVEGDGSLIEGLKRWWELDPAVDGLVTAERQADEWVLRGRASDDESRRAMMERGVGLFETPREIELQASDGFFVFRDPKRADAAIGLWRGIQATADERARDLCERLGPLLPLIARASGTAPVPRDTQARELMMSALDARMRSCERRDGRLGLMIAERTATSGMRLQSDLKEILRGSDWSVVEGARVYVLLDEPDQGWQNAVEARLRELRGFENLRLVGVAWRPSGGNARALIESAERALSEQSTTPTVQFIDM